MSVKKTAGKNSLISVGILGAGKMGEALVKGLLRKRASEFKLSASTRSSERATDLSKRLGIFCHTDNARLVQESKVIILCVKPHQIKNVLKPIAEYFTKDHLLISISASVTLDQLSKWIAERSNVLRAMPNTPALIGEGVTALCAKEECPQEYLSLAQKIFESVGPALFVEERLMDGVTGLSGCGPAYVYLIIEALSEAGVKVGLPRKVATLLATQTLLGASKMVMARDEHPAFLKDEVTTPAGCTIDGLMALEEGKLRVTLIKAVLAATKRSSRLRESQE